MRRTKTETLHDRKVLFLKKSFDHIKCFYFEKRKSKNNENAWNREDEKSLIWQQQQQQNYVFILFMIWANEYKNEIEGKNAHSTNEFQHISYAYWIQVFLNFFSLRFCCLFHSWCFCIVVSLSKCRWQCHIHSFTSTQYNIMWDVLLTSHFVCVHRYILHKK